MHYTIENHCRLCGSSNLEIILDLGETALADRLLTSIPVNGAELTAQLTLVFCNDCTLTQIRETVDPTVLFFDEYPYFSSISSYLLNHFRQSALNLINRKNLDSQSLVIEAASNDGYMLKNFLERSIPVLGIDPAKPQATAAKNAGIPTLCTFFTGNLAQELKQQGKSADVFLANNVLAHVPDLNGFVKGISIILKETGTAVIEVPYLKHLIDNCEFDTIYHQHLCYFSVKALDTLFRNHNLYLNHVEQIAIHGGSLRLFIEPIESVGESVTELLKIEKNEGLDNILYYSNFAKRVQNFKRSLLDLLHDLRRKGNNIVGYGAAAKATTLLNYCEIDNNILEYVVDLNKYKQGKYMGLNYLPILPIGKIMEDQPDYTLILAWNFADEIIKTQEEYHKKGGKFIIPIPEPKIL